MLIWLQELGTLLLILLLAVLDGVFEIFSAVSGLTEITVDGNQQTLAEYFINLSGVQRAFWIVVIASVGICAVCTVIAIVKSIINAKGGEPKSSVRILGQAIGSILAAMFMAMFFMVGIGSAETLLREVNTAINGGEELHMSHNIIEVSLDSGGYLYDTKNLQGLNESDGEGGWTYLSYVYNYDTVDENEPVMKCTDPSKLPEPKRYEEPGYEDCIIYFRPDGESAFEASEIYTDTGTTDEEGNTIYITDTSKLTAVPITGGWLSELGKNSLCKNIMEESPRTLLGTYTTGFIFPSNWNYDGKINPDSINYLVAYACTIIVLVALVSATFGLVKRLFDLVMLFITLPGITATIPLDDGAKFKLWRETVISKVFLAFGSVLAVNVFSIVSPALWNINIEGASTFFVSLLKVILICGGALTISGGQLLFSRLLGTSAEESREMGQSARTLMGGAMTAAGIGKAVGGAVFGGKNANGQRVGGLLKGGAGALGAIAGGAINALGGAIGGQAYKNSKFGKGVSKTQNALRGFSGSAGWFGKDKSTGNNTLGGAISSGIGSLGSKFAGSKLAQKSGLKNGVSGAIQTSRNKRRAKSRDNTQGTKASGQKTRGNVYAAVTAAVERAGHDPGNKALPGSSEKESALPEAIPPRAPNDDGTN